MILFTSIMSGLWQCCKLFKQKHRFLFINLEVPLILRHHRHNRSPLTVVRTTGLNDLDLSFQMFLLNPTFHLFIQMLAAAVFALASTAYVKNTFRRMSKFLRHVPKILKWSMKFK